VLLPEDVILLRLTHGALLTLEAFARDLKRDTSEQPERYIAKSDGLTMATQAEVLSVFPHAELIADASAQRWYRHQCGHCGDDYVYLRKCNNTYKEQDLNFCTF
jgi:hypothetical protein